MISDPQDRIRTVMSRVIVSVAAICLIGLLPASLVSAGFPASPPAPLSLLTLPDPITIAGSPLRVAIGSDSSIQAYYNGLGQVYGWQDGGADSGVWLRIGSDIYGPDACFSGRLTTSMYTVRPWTAVSHSGPTGSGAAADPWVITTVLGAGSTGVQVTQRASYVNGQDYFRLEWSVANASGSTQTVSLFHAVDSYFANDDYGRGYYDPASGAVGAYVPSGPWYMLFVPATPATAYKEDWYFNIWAGIGYCGDNASCPVSAACSPGSGFDNTIDTSTDGVDNGFGLQWQRTIGSGASATVGDWWTFGSIPILPGEEPTSTPTATRTPTATPSRTPTATGTVEVCNQTITASYGPPSAANTWQRFTIPLTAGTFGVDSATFQNVMSQVTQFRIRTEMHDGADVGGVDNAAVGSRFSTGFAAGPEGWTAAGDGTMEWKEAGGNPGGYLQVSDWATGDWHWAVAPVSWAGNWSDLIGASLGFDVKTNYPDYASIIEISCAQTKRLTLTANPFVLPPGGSSNMTVGLSESAGEAVVVSLASSATGCITVPASVTVPQGQTSANFLAQVAAGATLGCEAVITASHAAYGASRLTLRVASVTATPTPTATPTSTATPGGCGGPTEAGTVVRTLAYHQVTSFISASQPAAESGRRASILSADGSRAAFAVSGGGVPCHIYVIDADGTGQRDVGTLPVDSGGQVDISADGSKVLYWNWTVAYMVNADGTNRHQVIELGAYPYFRLSADGTRVYFAIDRDVRPNVEYKAGLYVVNADGSGVRRIVTPEPGACALRQADPGAAVLLVGCGV